jgi:hypothetical protein
MVIELNHLDAHIGLFGKCRQKLHQDFFRISQDPVLLDVYHKVQRPSKTITGEGPHLHLDFVTNSICIHASTVAETSPTFLKPLSYTIL